MANVVIVYYEYSNDNNICFWFFDGFLFCKLIEEIDAGDQSTPEGDLNAIRVGFGSSGPDLTHQLKFNSAVQGSGESLLSSCLTECSP